MMKFGIAAQKLTEQTTIFYTTCDFTHMNQVFSGLTSFKSVQPYGELASRVVGLLIHDFWSYLSLI